MRNWRCVILQLTTQAQRPAARDASMATATLPPGSLQRLLGGIVWLINRDTGLMQGDDECLQSATQACDRRDRENRTTQRGPNLASVSPRRPCACPPMPAT